MDFIKSLAVAASGLRAQAGRMRVISENIANADSTAQTPEGDPYRRRIPTFVSQLDRALDAAAPGETRPDCVRVEVSARTSSRERAGLREVSQREWSRGNDRHA